MGAQTHEIGQYVYEGNVANKALELMGKELGMFKDKLEVSGGRDPIRQVTVVRTIRDDS